MNEKWTYLVLSDPDKNPTGFRITLEDRDSQKKATIQLTAAGEQVDLDQQPHDYECMEWKAKEILDVSRTDGNGEVVLGAVKDHLRSAFSG
jgi:hypothetical protein